MATGADVRAGDPEGRATDGESAAIDPRIGGIVVNFRIERQLGAGGMGSVYLARHVDVPELVAALKVLGGTPTDMLRERFRQEATIAAILNRNSHRVVKPINFGHLEDGTPCLMMEYVDGPSLSQHLKGHGQLPLVVALKIASRVADTLTLAHALSFVHRDVKPANILLAQEGPKEWQPKLCDFGVARASGEAKIAHTRELSIIGTAGYMSPEAATGLGVDGRTDVFSLGVVLFEMLTGVVPFAAPTAQEAISNVLTRRPPDIRPLRLSHLEAVPPAVEEIVLHALAKKPEERYTMAQLLEALSSALSRLEGQPEAAIPQTAMSLFTPLPGSREAPTLSAGAAQVAALIDRLTPAPLSAAGPSPTVQGYRASAPTGMGAIEPPKVGRPALLASLGAALVIVAGAGVVWYRTGRGATAVPATPPGAIAPSAKSPPSAAGTLPSAPPATAAEAAASVSPPDGHSATPRPRSRRREPRAGAPGAALSDAPVRDY